MMPCLSIIVYRAYLRGTHRHIRRPKAMMATRHQRPRWPNASVQVRVRWLRRPGGHPQMNTAIPIVSYIENQIKTNNLNTCMSY